MTPRMRAVICRRPGRPEDLEIGTCATVHAGPGEVRIRVEACGINYPDLLLIAGKYQDKPALPFVPGGEVAGVIDEVGPGTTGLTPGEAVVATVMLGGLAEHVVAKATHVEPLPAGMSMIQGAAFTGVYGTAYHALVQRARLAAGETLLVLGAAGGTGIAAVQLGRALGARVIAAAGTDAKLAFLRSQGADAVVNYHTSPLRDAVRDLTAGRGADVIFDPVGGVLFDAAVRCINWNGRLLVVGFASGTIPQLPVNLALLKGFAVAGVYFGRFREEEPGVAAANMGALRELWLAGRIAPPIYRVFPLADTPAALACLEDRRVMGKVVVRVRP
jgi:NADPH2:quinone reductase